MIQRTFCLATLLCLTMQAECRTEYMPRPQAPASTTTKKHMTFEGVSMQITVKKFIRALGKKGYYKGSHNTEEKSYVLRGEERQERDMKQQEAIEKLKEIF